MHDEQSAPANASTPQLDDSDTANPLLAVSLKLKPPDPAQPKGSNTEPAVHEGMTTCTCGADGWQFFSSKSREKLTGLKEYVGRMKEGQHDIFYITGKSISALSAATLPKPLRKKDVEVLYITNPIEEYAVQQLQEFDGKQLQSAIQSSAEHDDSINSTNVAELWRFHSSQSDDTPTGLKEYVARVKHNQRDILYITGESIEAVSTSPLLKTLHKKGLEVLYITRPIEEYAVQQLQEFDGKTLTSAASESMHAAAQETGAATGDGLQILRTFAKMMDEPVRATFLELPPPLLQETLTEIAAKLKPVVQGAALTGHFEILSGFIQEPHSDWLHTGAKSTAMLKALTGAIGQLEAMIPQES
jgi:hypothetical protein